MGEFLESLGKIDGYDIISIGKMKAKKDEIFDEIEQYDGDIKEKVRKLVNESSGKVFAIVRDGIIKGLYLFEIEKKEDNRNLKHIETIYTDEVSEEVREKYNEHVLKVATDFVSMREYDKVILEDKVVQKNSEQTKKEHTMAWLGGFALGFAMGWIIFDDLTWAFLYGIIFAPIFAGADVVISNKRNKKNSDENKKE